MRTPTDETTEAERRRTAAAGTSASEGDTRPRSPWLTDIGEHRRSGVAEPVEVPPLPDRQPGREAEPVGVPGEDR